MSVAPLSVVCRPSAPSDNRETLQGPKVFSPEDAFEHSLRAQEADDLHFNSNWWQNPIVQFAIGQQFEEGRCCRADFIRSVECYRRSAEAGYPPAVQKIAALCANRGVFLDRLRSAVAEDNLPLLYHLGASFSSGRGVEQNLALAAQIFELGDRSGDVRSRYRLGKSYLFGEGVPRDLKRALPLLESAEQGGDPSAMNDLGMCYFHKIGVPENPERAVRLFEKGARRGNPQAKGNLAASYEEGRGVGQDLVKAFRLYGEAAEDGDLNALCRMGVCYLEGIGVSQDPVRAVALFEEGANQGHPLSKTLLGLCLEKGFGYSKDVARAVALYEEAARDGCILGMKLLGQYCQKRMEPGDGSQAAELFKKAAEGGDGEAMFLFAECLCRGAGVDRDRRSAFNWYFRSANAPPHERKADAWSRLAVLYLTGLGGAQNPEMVEHCLEQAAQFGGWEG